MKKIISVMAAMLLVSSLSFAENNTRIASDERVSYGGYIGFAQGAVAHYCDVFFDINSAKNNLRTRLHIGNIQRWMNPNLGISEQYLFPIVGGLYVFPSVGVGMDFYVDKVGTAPKGSVGININGGAGLEYQFNNTVGLFVQGGYDLMLKGLPNRVFLQTGIVLNLH